LSEYGTRRNREKNQPSNYAVHHMQNIFTENYFSKEYTKIAKNNRHHPTATPDDAHLRAHDLHPQLRMLQNATCVLSSPLEQLRTAGKSVEKGAASGTSRNFSNPIFFWHIVGRRVGVRD
jgi:hypothetical protein